MWHICNLIIASSVILLPIISHIFGFAQHINEFKLREILYIRLPKCLVDRENLYLILLYVDASLCIGGTAMVATGLIFLTYFKHICGMLRIAR